ncbi:MAG: vitamin B12 dependent-methionine synthase activation domain-containing protein, partial [Acidobacteriota bacterium]
MVHVAREMERLHFQLPLMIGGATTSKLHTAIRIAPAYSGPTVHVLDASRCVQVVGSIIDSERRPEFDRLNRLEQEKLRVSARDRQQDLKLLSIAEARARKLSIDWNSSSVEKPSFVGVRSLEPSLQELIPFIDWTPFFHAWELRGTYPAIFDEPEVGPRARELFEDAQQLLERIVAGRLLTARVRYGIFPANAVGDDVVLYADESRSDSLAVIHTLRQQADKGPAQPDFALADFVAPRDSGLPDYAGAFVVTAGIGVAELVTSFEKDHDDYGAIMTKALADRLAEAAAEWLHKRVRDEWGYGGDENLTQDELRREKYRGIRPAPGYPACPDHSEKRALFDLLNAEAEIGVTLTEHFAMSPAAAVSGWYFGHPQSRYFSVGKVGRDQVFDYHLRKDVPLAVVERWLAPVLGYEPGANDPDGPCSCGREHRGAARPARPQLAEKG